MKDLSFLKNTYFAHRGLFNNKNIPENSCYAFRKAILNNMAIEFDIQLLKDETIIVFHDKNLKRMTGINKNIEDCTYEEIKNIYLLNTKEKIPTLEEVLNLVDGKVILDIEYKSTNNLNKLINNSINILNTYKGPFIISSFHPICLYKLKKKKPTWIYGLIKVLPANKNIFIINSWILKIIKANFIAYNKKSIKKKYIQQLRKKYPLIAWTIKTYKELDDYKDFADSFITENIDL